MTADTKFILGAVIVSALIITGASVALSKDNAPKREEQGTASMTIDKTSEDFGSMKVSDEKSAVFTITNTGSSPLRIWGVATSCNCTFATLTIRGTETEEFSMAPHMPARLKNWIGEVPAGEKALLKVTYRPKVMPVSGPVSRQTRFSTNDPKNPDIEVSVTANVL